MRRFRFRLSPLLRLRAQFERASRRELARAVQAVDAIDQKLAAAAQGLRDCAAEAPRADAVGRLARALEDGLRRHQWRLGRQRHDAQQQLDTVRADYVHKARELRSVQRLREQRHADWRQATQRAEQAELDELAAMARSARVAAGDDRDGGVIA